MGNVRSMVDPPASGRVGAARPAPPFTLPELVGAYGAAFLLAAIAMLAERAGLMDIGAIPYGNDGTCDAWQYIGLSLFPDAGPAYAANSRVLSRPLFFGVLHAARALLPWADVNTLNYFIFVPLTTAATYVAFRSIFAVQTAAAGALLIGSAPFLLVIGSMTYMSAACIAYSSCMLACCMWGGRKAEARASLSDLLFAAGGLFFAFSANANLMSLKFNFLFCLFALPVHLLSRDRATYRTVTLVLVRSGALFWIGMIAGVVVAFLFSWALGLGLWTPYLQVRDALGGLGDWRYPGWLETTLAFVMILLILVFCGLALHETRGRSDLQANRIRLAVGVAALTCLYNLQSTIFIGDQNLVYDVYYFFLLPSLGLAFCAAIDGPVRDRGLGRAALAALVSTVIVLNVAIANLPNIREAMLWKTQWAAYGIAIVLLAVAAMTRARSRAAFVAGIVLLTACLHVMNGSTVRHYFQFQRADERDIARTTERALTFLYRHLTELPVVWIADADNHRLDLPVFRGLLRCSFEPSFPDRLPDPNLHWQPPLAAGRTLVVIDGAASPAVRIAEALAPHGLHFEPIASRYFSRIEGVPLGVQITIGKVR
ncbi:MAG: hypothetical protein ACHQK9_04665 [Reyranellales bacterium]